VPRDFAVAQSGAEAIDNAPSSKLGNEFGPGKPLMGPLAP
jgi:hypothetical protein